MRTHVILARFISRPLLIAAIFVVPMIGLAPVRAAVVDPLANGPVDPDLFDAAPAAKPVTRIAPASKQKQRQAVQPVNFQANQTPPDAESAVQTLPAPAAPAAADAPKDPCAAVPNKPLNQLGIGIAEPEGKLPTDLAAPCWTQINQTGPSASARCWPIFSYNWEATCFYHNPLYFEEINLERYGYQCGDRSCCVTRCRECCLQPAASAAHFYGSLLALPYCMAVDCPGDCVYTLGHYRPGNCNPKRRHWPPCDPIAAAAEGGVWTGLIFAIP